MSRMRVVMGALSALMLLSPTLAPAQEANTPIDAVDGYHKALALGDTAQVLSLLARDLVVFEFGIIDPTVEAYSFQHLPFDEDMAAASTWTLLTRQVGGDGDTRFVLSSYQVNGVDAVGAVVNYKVFESAIVSRISGRWRISHLHWSTDNSAFNAQQQGLRLSAPNTANPYPVDPNATLPGSTPQAPAN